MTASLFAALLAILSVDLLHLHTSIGAAIGLGGWSLLHLVIFCVALAELRSLFGDLSSAPAVLTLCALVFIIAVLFWSISDYRVLSQEGAVELRCVHDILTDDPEFGFWGTCLFGYPARQSYLHYAPTLLFGESLAALNSGGLIYLVLGLIIFAGNIYRHSKCTLSADLTLAFALILIFHFFYFNETSYRPNMAAFPVGISFIAIGTLLRFNNAPSKVNFLLINASLVLALHSYTPNLATFFGILGIILLLAIKAPSSCAIPRTAYIACILIFICTFLRTLEYRYDIRLFSEHSDPGGAGTLTALVESLRFVILGSDFMTTSSKVVVLIAMIYGLVAIRNFQVIYAVIFILAVLLAASITKGFGFLGVDLRMHRAIVGIPALLTLIFFVFSDILSRIRNTHALISTQLILAATIPLVALDGLNYRFDFFAHKKPHPHLLFIEKLNRAFPSLDRTKPTDVSLGLESLPDLLSLSDTIGYFYPRSNVYTLSQECEARMPRDEGSTEILILEKSSNCRGASVGQRICAVATNMTELTVNQNSYIVCVRDTPAKS